MTLFCLLVLTLAGPLVAQDRGSARPNIGGPTAAQVPLPKLPVAPVREAAVDVEANRLPLGENEDGEEKEAGLEQLLSPSGLTPTLKVMMLLSLLSVAPAVLIMTTSFVRFVIVFGLLRQALGTKGPTPLAQRLQLSPALGERGLRLRLRRRLAPLSFPWRGAAPLHGCIAMAAGATGWRATVSTAIKIGRN